jgi:hypothetical protein
MGAISDWMARRSGVELFFIFGIFFGALLGLIMSSGGLSIDFVYVVVGSAIFGGLLTATTLWGRRESGGKALMVQINSAIKTGELPELIDPRAWLAQLDRRLVNLRRSQVSFPIIYGIIVACELFVGLTGPHPNYAIVGLAVVVALVAVAGIYSNRRRIPKIETLAQKIRGTYNLQDADGTASAS